MNFNFEEIMRQVKQKIILQAKKEYDELKTKGKVGKMQKMEILMANLIGPSMKGFSEYYKDEVLEPKNEELYQYWKGKMVAVIHETSLNEEEYELFEEFLVILKSEDWIQKCIKRTEEVQKETKLHLYENIIGLLNVMNN